MNEDDFAEFATVIAGFAELRGRTLSKPAIKLYWRAMQHWPLELFKSAAEHLLRTHTRFDIPGPADFEALRSAWQNTTAEAWGRAVAFSRTLYTPHGPREGAIGDYLIDSAVRCIGGYAAIAKSSVENLVWLEKRFAERLTELQDVVSTRAALPTMPESLRISTGGPVAVKNLLPRLSR